MHKSRPTTHRVGGGGGGGAGGGAEAVGGARRPAPCAGARMRRLCAQAERAEPAQPSLGGPFRVYVSEAAVGYGGERKQSEAEERRKERERTLLI